MPQKLHRWLRLALVALLLAAGAVGIYSFLMLPPWDPELREAFTTFILGLAGAAFGLLLAWLVYGRAAFAETEQERQAFLSEKSKELADFLVIFLPALCILFQLVTLLDFPSGQFSVPAIQATAIIPVVCVISFVAVSQWIALRKMSVTVLDPRAALASRLISIHVGIFNAAVWLEIMIVGVLLCFGSSITAWLVAAMCYAPSLIILRRRLVKCFAAKAGLPCQELIDDVIKNARTTCLAWGGLFAFLGIFPIGIGHFTPPREEASTKDNTPFFLLCIGVGTVCLSAAIGLRYIYRPYLWRQVNRMTRQTEEKRT